MQPYEEVAVTFARALVDGDFLRAHELLTPQLRVALSPTALREELREMYDGYAEGPPTQIHYDEQFSMTDWPAKKPGDVGWAYVGIMGEDFVEAVTVVVHETDGMLLISQIEWGRP
jgi:hypothetical protein